MLRGAEPFAHEGQQDAPRVVLSHGFTGSPQTLRGLAEHLAGEGMTVRLPLLPGHGTRWQDMVPTRWEDWLGALERHVLDLSTDGRRVALVGLSMGGALVLRLAAALPQQVSAVVAINPAVFVNDPRFRLLPLLSRVKRSYPGIIGDAANGAPEVGYDRVPLEALRSQIAGWQETAASLGRITSPVLLLSSRTDHVVPTDNGARIAARLTRAPVRHVWLDRSYHLATIDHDAALVRRLTTEFIRENHDDHA